MDSTNIAVKRKQHQNDLEATLIFYNLNSTVQLVRSQIPNVGVILCRTLIVPLIPLSLSAQAAFACACCADPGYRENGTIDFSADFEDYIWRLSQVETDGQARIYTDNCGLDCIKGLTSLEDTVDIDISVSGATLLIMVNQGQPSQAKLHAAIPNQAYYFAVDPMTGDYASMRYLYTELRLALQLFGDGPGWEGGSTAIPAEFILTGHGNTCPSFGGAQNWVLDVGGPDENAMFRLFGKTPQEN